jgi:hypothetical protein
MKPILIAPCGMNCGICSAYLRVKNHCPGCNIDTSDKKYLVVCKMRNCDKLTGIEQKFCFGCAKFPCLRMRQLDKRYRTKYGMSMIENLENIKDIGIDEFVANEQERWKCPGCGKVICVHKKNCIYCGWERSYELTPSHP